MEEIEQQIKTLEGKLTGDMMMDMELMDEIHKLTLRMNGEERFCSLDDPECEACGS